ncbi:MAG: efflux RND transporter periplasmic adaptor subunit [Acidobacteriota bacterium]|nr:efflux RND transporter periplasmic adaptor subunit [Acidobacteriota bacterium]
MLPSKLIRGRSHRRIAGLLFLLAVLGCGKKVSEKSDTLGPAAGPKRVSLTAGAVSAAAIKIETVEAGPLDEILTLSGSLAYDENKVSKVGPRIGGRVSRILVDFGQQVRAGQVLAEIDSPDLGQAVADWRKAHSVFNVRQRDFERAQKLLDGKAISQGEFLSRQGEFNVAKSELENADSRLHLFGLSHSDLQALFGGGEVNSRFPLRSPISGKVIERQINPGEVVETAKSLFTIGDIRSLWLIAQLFEKDLARVHAGQSVEVSTDAFPGTSFKGVINYVGDQVEAATRTVRARAIIANPKQELKPGMFVEARLAVASAAPVVKVPTAAIQEIDKQPTVFVQVSPNVFEPRSVETGRVGQTSTEIRKGIRAGDRVVTEGSLTVKAQLLKSALGGD